MAYDHWLEMTTPELRRAYRMGARFRDIHARAAKTAEAVAALYNPGAAGHSKTMQEIAFCQGSRTPR